MIPRKVLELVEDALAEGADSEGVVGRASVESIARVAINALVAGGYSITREDPEPRPCLCGWQAGADGWCPVHGGALSREAPLARHVTRLAALVQNTQGVVQSATTGTARHALIAARRAVADSHRTTNVPDTFNGGRNKAIKAIDELIVLVEDGR